MTDRKKAAAEGADVVREIWYTAQESMMQAKPRTPRALANANQRVGSLLTPSWSF